MRLELNTAGIRIGKLYYQFGERVMWFGHKRIYNLCLFGRMALNITYNWDTCTNDKKWKFAYSEFMLPEWMEKING